MPRSTLVLGKGLGAGVRGIIQAFTISVLAAIMGVQGLGQLILMPLFFASNALYPVDIMPSYVAALASFNPLSYMVDALRGLMVEGSRWHFSLGLDLAVLL